MEGAEVLITSESSFSPQQLLPMPRLSYYCCFLGSACAELPFSGAPPAADGSLLAIAATLRSLCCYSRFAVVVLLIGLCDLSGSVSVISISAPPAGIAFLMALL